MQSHALNEIQLHFVPNSYITILAADYELPRDGVFNISIPLTKEYGSMVPSTFLYKLVIPEFSCVTQLKFYPTGPINSTFGPFFSCFTSLTNIYANSETLGYLTALQNDMNAADMQIILFPSLSDIDLVGDFHEDVIFKVDAVIAEFILMRIGNGHPISTLCLLDYCCKVAPDLETLSRAKGLKVMCIGRGTDVDEKRDNSGALRVQEYICGSIDRENSSNGV